MCGTVLPWAWNLRHPSGTPRVKTGFTLIELLVVAAILTLLISMLIPSMAMARERARVSVCTKHYKFGKKGAMGIGRNTLYADWHIGFRQCVDGDDKITPAGPGAG